MTFLQFLQQVFSFFHSILVYISGIFNLLINNNIIKFSVCIGILFFIIDYQFEIIGLLPKILGFSGEQDKEFETKSVTISHSDFIDNNKITRSTNRIKRRRLY